MRQLIVGDIHGCYAELCDLLDVAGLSSEDEIIAIGDIVDRGSESPRVLGFFRRQPNARSLMGNHERKHFRSFAGELQPALSQIITRDQLGQGYGAAIEYMRGLPHRLELPGATLVHGFFEPGVPVAEQPLQVIIGTLSGDAHLRERYAQTWYELCDGEKPLIVGHHDFLRTGQALVYEDRVYGLYTFHRLIVGGRQEAIHLGAGGRQRAPLLHPNLRRHAPARLRWRPASRRRSAPLAARRGTPASGRFPGSG